MYRPDCEAFVRSTLSAIVKKLDVLEKKLDEVAVVTAESARIVDEHSKLLVHLQDQADTLTIETIKKDLFKERVLTYYSNGGLVKKGDGVDREEQFKQLMLERHKKTRVDSEVAGFIKTSLTDWLRARRRKVTDEMKKQIVAAYNDFAKKQPAGRRKFMEHLLQSPDARKAILCASFKAVRPREFTYLDEDTPKELTHTKESFEFFDSKIVANCRAKKKKDQWLFKPLDEMLSSSSEDSAVERESLAQLRKKMLRMRTSSSSSSSSSSLNSSFSNVSSTSSSSSSSLADKLARRVGDNAKKNDGTSGNSDLLSRVGTRQDDDEDEEPSLVRKRPVYSVDGDDKDYDDDDDDDKVDDKADDGDDGDDDDDDKPNARKNADGRKRKRDDDDNKLSGRKKADIRRRKCDDDHDDKPNARKKADGRNRDKADDDDAGGRIDDDCFVLDDFAQPSATPSSPPAEAPLSQGARTAQAEAGLAKRAQKRVVRPTEKGLEYTRSRTAKRTKKLQDASQPAKASPRTEQENVLAVLSSSQRVAAKGKERRSDHDDDDDDGDADEGGSSAVTAGRFSAASDESSLPHGCESFALCLRRKGASKTWVGTAMPDWPLSFGCKKNLARVIGKVLNVETVEVDECVTAKLDGGPKEVTIFLGYTSQKPSPQKYR